MADIGILHCRRLTVGFFPYWIGFSWRKVGGMGRVADCGFVKFVLAPSHKHCEGSLLTDLEMVRACAEAIDLGCFEVSLNDPQSTIRLNGSQKNYWPLTNDEQAMTLVRRLRLTVTWHSVGSTLNAICYDPKGNNRTSSKELSRAIVECAAQIRNSSSTTATRK